MWKLKNTKKEHWDHFVLVGEECVVGRKDATLLISNDPSLSRRHAVLFVKHPEENLGYPTKKSSLFLRDENSKYGTFKNKVRITNEEQLSDGDVVKFGQFESEFRIHYEPLIVTTSCLDIASKNKLRKIIHKLGGHIVSEWQPSCTHLVMNLVKITIKALCCLVSLKPIVLPEYFDELAKKLKVSATVILPNEFIPPVGESLIDKDVVSFAVNPERKNLFKNKTFFFMDNKQFKKLFLGVITAGGKASICEGKFDPDLLKQENNCFIEPVKSQLITEESKNLFKVITNTLQTNSLRMIPESDIGLAVAYASTEKYCNPKFDIGSVFLGSQGIPSQSLTEREVYVPDTQESIKRPKPSTSNFLSSLSSQSKSKKQKVEAADSLNLTTFREEDPEEVFEIPLSAEVKRELDNIFTDHDAEEELDIEPTMPVEQEPEFEVNPVVPKRIESIIKNTISSKVKTEENFSVVNGNGDTSFDKNDAGEENIPRNLIKVQFASLVVRKPVFSTQNQLATSHMKNFKKFKKVLPLRAQALPRIIGIHELAPYDKDASKLTEDADDVTEMVNAKPVKGIFDWGSQN